jgi:hypothetical protein
MRLKYHFAVSMQATQSKLVQDIGGCTFNASRPVDIFNPHQPLALESACI